MTNIHKDHDDVDEFQDGILQDGTHFPLLLGGPP